MNEISDTEMTNTCHKSENGNQIIKVTESLKMTIEDVKIHLIRWLKWQIYMIELSRESCSTVSCPVVFSMHYYFPICFLFGIYSLFIK